LGFGYSEHKTSNTPFAAIFILFPPYNWKICILYQLKFVTPQKSKKETSKAYKNYG
jgi:hypothetical protein